VIYESIREMEIGREKLSCRLPIHERKFKLEFIFVSLTPICKPDDLIHHSKYNRLLRGQEGKQLLSVRRIGSF
jgi:hypothetical protein